MCFARIEELLRAARSLVPTRFGNPEFAVPARYWGDWINNPNSQT